MQMIMLTIASSEFWFTDLKKKTGIELNKLTVNYRKTQCLLSCNESLNRSFKIKSGNVEVTNNNTVKYLGTALDNLAASHSDGN